MIARPARCKALLTLGVLSAALWTLPTVSARDDTPSGATLSAVDLNRGRALYDAACDACHTQNIHWRDKRLASSWDTLVREVKRWQGNTGRGWKQDEIHDVSAYLNERFYHLPCPADLCTEKQAAATPQQPR